MKKALGLLVVLTLLIAGCGPTQTPPPPVPTQAKTTTHLNLVVYILDGAKVGIEGAPIDEIKFVGKAFDGSPVPVMDNRNTGQDSVDADGTSHLRGRVSPFKWGADLPIAIVQSMVITVTTALPRDGWLEMELYADDQLVGGFATQDTTGSIEYHHAN